MMSKELPEIGVTARVKTNNGFAEKVKIVGHENLDGIDVAVYRYLDRGPHCQYSCSSAEYLMDIDDLLFHEDPEWWDENAPEGYDYYIIDNDNVIEPKFHKYDGISVYTSLDGGFWNTHECYEGELTIYKRPEKSRQ